MDAVRIALLREVLDGTEWLEATRRFAGALRASVGRHRGGLLLVGSEEYEPWHLAAHLDDEAVWAGVPELSPTLVRHRARPGQPAHLGVGLQRIEAARRGETLLVVTPHRPETGLLERVHGARRAGATVLALDSGDHDLHTLAHEALAAPERDPWAWAERGPGTAGLPECAEPGGGGGVEAADGRPGFGLDTVQHLVSAAAGENGLPHPAGRRRWRALLSRLAEHLVSPPPARW